jgi:hypothetical protein
MVEFLIWLSKSNTMLPNLVRYNQISPLDTRLKSFIRGDIHRRGYTKGISIKGIKDNNIYT